MKISWYRRIPPHLTLSVSRHSVNPLSQGTQSIHSVNPLSQGTQSIHSVSQAPPASLLVVMLPGGFDSPLLTVDTVVIVK